MSSGGGTRKAPEKGHHPVWAVDPVMGNAIIYPRKELLARQRKIVGRVAAFDELHRNLAVATEVYLHMGDGGRQGIYDVTCALVGYLTGQGIPFAALEPLIAVQTATVDADHGTASPIFTPTRKSEGGKPPVSDLQRAFDAKIATVVECCVLHYRAEGRRPYLQPAAQFAATLINASLLARPQKVTARDLEELRERFRQSRKGSVDRKLFDAYFNSGVAGANPLAFARALLAHKWVNPPSTISG